jgi:hypothetical protein
LKLGKSIKYIIFKLSNDFRSVVVEETSEDKDWETFREKLINAKTKSKQVCRDGDHDWDHVGYRQISLTHYRGRKARAQDTQSTTSSTILRLEKENGKMSRRRWNIESNINIATRLPSSHGLQMMQELVYVLPHPKS